jgi:hypothetical protein
VLIQPRIKTAIRRLSAFVGVFVAILALALANNTHTFAAAVTDTTNTLRVTPVRTDLTLNPGESKTVEVTVTNITTTDIAVQPIENDFIAGDESGTPSLILGQDDFAPTHSLKRFMAPLSTATIAAGASKTFQVAIKVPANAQAGGYFGALRFAPTSSNNGGQVNLSASVASIMLLTVSGPTTEKLNLTNFEVQKGGKDVTYAMDGKDMQVHLRFENKGNIQEGPTGTISIKRNGTQVINDQFNNISPKDVILPDSARQWNISLDSSKLNDLGKYTVLGTFSYGQSNDTIQFTRTFWVIPLWSIIAAAAILLVLAGVVLLIIFAIRRRNRRNYRRSSLRRR